MILRKKYFIKSLDQSGVDNIQYFIKQINLNILYIIYCLDSNC